MSTLIKHHPALLFQKDVLAICKPLKQLGIDYFAHVHIDTHNQFSTLASSAGFTEHYLRNQYYNVDIHMAKDKNLGSYVLWDLIERKGQSAKMHKEAGTFGIKHTFTLIEKNKNGSDYYHFASSTPSLTINQTYLANVELLKLFIPYFHEKVQTSRELSKCYQLKFAIAPHAEGYLIASHLPGIDDIHRHHFLKNISNNIHHPSNTLPKEEIILRNRYTLQPIKLTQQQAKCLRLLVAGHTNKQIANLLRLSTRTVENYFSHLRTLLDCKSSKELIALYYGSQPI